MRVSIIVPSFNQAQYLAETLRSLVNQGYRDKEIIVMDGGSTDGSVAVIKEYESKLAYWRSDRDGGQADAIKSGFEIATGDLIGWLNSDDVLVEGALDRLVNAVNHVQSAECVFTGGFEVIDAKGQTQEVFPGAPIVPWVARAIGPAICQPGTFFGRLAYTRVGGIDQSLKYGMDFDLWMRFLSAGVPFVVIREVQAKFRRHSGQKGHSLEWLKHCDDEEDAIQQSYKMARKGGGRWAVARLVQLLHRISSSGFLRTMAYRIINRHRIRQYSTSYSD